MLKVGGIWVSPFEVEEALIGHPAVLEAAVVGHPDADGLIKPKAFVVLQQSAPATTAAALCEALQDHVKEPHRRVEIPALDRVRRQPAEDRDRQNPALQIAAVRLGGAEAVGRRPAAG